MSRSLPEEIVDALLDNKQSPLDAFIAHGLGQTDPFASIGAVRTVGPDNKRVVYHRYAGKYWRVSGIIQWNPVNYNLQVYFNLENCTRAVMPVWDRSSLYKLPPEYLGKANAVLIAACARLDKIADTMDIAGYLDHAGYKAVKDAVSEVMSDVDDEFIQYDSLTI